MTQVYEKLKRRKAGRRKPDRPFGLLKPPLDLKTVLEWADAHHRRTGKWPKQNSGVVRDTLGETWRAVDMALKVGLRGLKGGYTLVRLLHEERGVYSQAYQPALTEKQILAWADAHFRRTGEWPSCSSGAIAGAPGESWRYVDAALRLGRRGLKPGHSLPKLLEERRGVRNHLHLPKFTLKGILEWADAHQRRTGEWPKQNSGVVRDTLGETWGAVDMALKVGLRGLKGGHSLVRLLHEERGVYSTAYAPPLTEKQILAWADAHFRRTGEWPSCMQGAIDDAPGESWRSVDAALRLGHRGLKPGPSLPKLLEERRGVRNRNQLPKFTLKGILKWADAHYRRTGHYPHCTDGSIEDAPEERWDNVDALLRLGGRGLPGGSSLPQLLQRQRGVINHWDQRPLTEEQILRWADAYRRRTGCWPLTHSPRVPGGPALAWVTINNALREGLRGLPGGTSLADLLARRRGVPP